MFRSTVLRKGPGLAIVLALVTLLAPAGAQARPEAKTSQNGCANTNLKPTRANLGSMTKYYDRARWAPKRANGLAFLAKFDFDRSRAGGAGVDLNLFAVEGC